MTDQPAPKPDLKPGTWTYVKQVNGFYRIEEVGEGPEGDSKLPERVQAKSNRRTVFFVLNVEDAKLVCAAVNAAPQLKAARDAAIKAQKQAKPEGPPKRQYPPGHKPPPLLPESAFRDEQPNPTLKDKA